MMWTLLCLWIASAAAADPAAGPPKVAVEIGVEDYALSQETRAELRRVMNRMLGFYSGVLGLDYPQEVPVRIRVIGTREAYDGYRRQVQAPHWSDGYFSYAPNEAVLWANTSVPAMMRVFLHESSHFLMGHNRGIAPRWANEGIAVCFQHARFSGNSLYLEPIPGAVTWLRQEAGEGRWIAARQVFADSANWSDLGREEASARYTFGWALTHFLLSTPQGKAVLKDLLARYRKNGDPAAAGEAVAAGYRGGVDGLEDDWRSWLEQGPRAVSIPIPSGGGGADSTWIRCPDGRMILKGEPLGCKTWVRQADGSLILQ